MRVLSLIVSKIDAISEWSGRILFPLILVMMGVLIYEVVLRYVFNSPTVWAHEAATMTYGSYTVLGGAYVLLYNEHVRVDILYARCSKRTKAMLDVCTFPLVLLFCGLLLWKSAFFGWESCLRWEHSVTAWSPPISPWKMTVPIAFLLVVLQGISDFIRNLILALSGKELL